MSTSDSPGRGGYHHGDLAEVLVQIAIEHIAESGTEKLSLRALARDAGVSPTAPYRHFPTKQCLLATIAARGFRQLEHTMREAHRSHEDPSDRFIAINSAYIRFALAHPVAYQIMFGSILGDFTEFDFLVDAAGACSETVLVFLSQFIVENELPYDVRQLSGIVWAGIHGCASLLLTLESKGPAAENLQSMQSIGEMAGDIEGSMRILFAHLIR